MTTSPAYILALDLGTTGNRALLFDAQGAVVEQAYKELTQHYPQPGWLEHDPMEIWQGTCWAMQKVLKDTGVAASDVVAMGLTVQRETCLLWDKTTGQPLHNAIVWQDRRTAPLCQQLAQGYAKAISDRTGLVLDAYFSATKLTWLLEWVRREQPTINLDNVLAGTIDSWVLWNLTGAQVHATDHSNASRTMLMNLDSQEWDPMLLDLFGIPASLMPKIQPSMGRFGYTDPQLFGAAIPITAIFGDQQASLFAQGCDHPGMVKCTYGTGCFLIAHTGELRRSQNQLLSTVAWTRAAADGSTQVEYALEGAMFTTGACVQWLRDGLKLIKTTAETELLACQVADTNGVYFVPALSGLGAPHWDMNARGAFFGITGGVQREHIVRAVLEAIAYQVKEVVQAINKDSNAEIALLKVDGGACENDFLMQFQADILGIPVERPAVFDATAQGAAFGAGLAVGFWQDYSALVAGRRIDRIFHPGRGTTQAQETFATWQKALKRVVST
jgi:glycerol kinase